MTLVKPRNLLAGAVALPLAAVIVAGCGGGSSAPSAVVTPPAASPTANKAATSAPTVRVANSSLGRMLVDAHGRTVYLFKKDKGTKSTCNGACAQAWPPVTVSGKPTAGTGAKASLLGTTKRSDGKTQVTYHGHPLYRFQGDQGRGEANGQGLVAFGAAWFVVSPAGEQISGSTRSGGSSAAKPAAPPAAKPAPPPAAKPAPKSSGNGIPQNNGGDQDSDNNGGPDDGDGGI